MGRRRKGERVNGWLVLDKPSGQTSTQALGAAKRLFNAQKAGHAGTLDPLATGVLPIAFGEATKTVPFAVDSAKAYQFTVRWGVETTTDDSEGDPTHSSDQRPAHRAVKDALAGFTGTISQIPPRFSAIKVDGQRAYDLARDGDVVALEARRIDVHEFTIVDVPDRDHMVFYAACGKGTYVRALARDLGRHLGCYGHVAALRRLRVGPFTEAEAVQLSDLQRFAQEGFSTSALSDCLLPVESALNHLPAFDVSLADATSLRCGRSILLRGRDAPVCSGPFFATCKGELVAVGEAEKGELRPTRVFQL